MMIFDNENDDTIVTDTNIIRAVVAVVAVVAVILLLVVPTFFS